MRRHYLGFVFQGYNLLNRTSALENVELPLIYRGTAAAERQARALSAIDAVGLKGWEDHTPGELSGGQQQRVAIARAIVTEPAVLLADEPTGNLDSARSREIMELLTSLNRDQGITIVMVTHEPDMAAYAKRQIHFLDGLVESDAQNGEAPMLMLWNAHVTGDTGDPSQRHALVSDHPRYRYWRCSGHHYGHHRRRRHRCRSPNRSRAWAAICCMSDPVSVVAVLEARAQPLTCLR